MIILRKENTCLHNVNQQPVTQILGYCSKFDNKDLIGGRTLLNIHGQPESACCALCHDTKDCKGYSWNSYSGGTCWLKSAIEPIINSVGVKVGIIGHLNPTKIGKSSFQ